MARQSLTPRHRPPPPMRKLSSNHCPTQVHLHQKGSEKCGSHPNLEVAEGKKRTPLPAHQGISPPATQAGPRQEPGPANLPAGTTCPQSCFSFYKAKVLRAWSSSTLRACGAQQPSANLPHPGLSSKVPYVPSPELGLDDKGPSFPPVPGALHCSLTPVASDSHASLPSSVPGLLPLVPMPSSSLSSPIHPNAGPVSSSEPS